jgi:hypothetical protein
MTASAALPPLTIGGRWQNLDALIKCIKGRLVFLEKIRGVL